jgi:hypothetical protein
MVDIYPYFKITTSAQCDYSLFVFVAMSKCNTSNPSIKITYY